MIFPTLLTPTIQTFLHFFTLRTGLLLILLTQLINKLTAFYGILALLTSYPLSPLQLSMYIYSLLVLALTLYLLPGVRKQDPWCVLVFAQTYTFDTIVNAVYTAAFSIAWFAVVASHDAQQSSSSGSGNLAADTIASTSGFTSPQAGNISHVAVLAAPVPGLKPGQEAVALGQPGFVAGVLSSGSLMSLAIILFFEGLRAYAVFVSMSYARQILRRHIATSSGYSYTPYSAGTAEMAEDPFAVGREEGKGWRGKIGRLLVGIGREYWLGRDESDDDEVWLRSVGGKFRRSSEQGGGVSERERRRRSGTDPPKPGAGVLG